MAEKFKGTRNVEVRSDDVPAKTETAQTARISPELEAKWREIQIRLRETLGTNKFNNWLTPMRIVSLIGGRLTLSSSSAFRREYVMNHYIDHLKLLWKHFEPSVRSIVISVEAESPMIRTMPMRQPQVTGRPTIPVARPSTQALLHNGSSQTSRTAPKPASGLLSNVTPNPQFTFENFVVGATNELALASARHVATEPGRRYSALYLHSPSGHGKTHLLNAIGNEAQRLNPDLKIAYVPAGSFMNHFGQATREGDPMPFRDFMRSLDVLMLDDLQFLTGRDATFREFTQTFKALQDMGKQVIIAADRPAAEIEGIDEHTRSRLCGALCVTIGSPDFDLRLKILRRKLADWRAAGRVVEVSDTVLEYIAHKIESNPRELFGALNCVANNSEVERAETSLEKAQELVRHLIRAPERKITIESIQDKVASFYHVSKRDMLSHRRDRVIVRPRQVAMFLCKALTTRSLPEIGRKFGGRDHTTVLYGVRRIDEMKKDNAALADEIDLLKRMIEN